MGYEGSPNCQWFTVPSFLKFSEDTWLEEPHDVENIFLIDDQHMIKCHITYYFDVEIVETRNLHLLQFIQEQFFNNTLHIFSEIMA